MYTQTDDRVSIYRSVEDKNTGEIDSFNVMRKWGCLYASLLYLIERETNKEFSASQVKLLFDYLTSIDVIRKDMYVKNHEMVLYNACRILGYEPYKIKYIAKVDYENDEETWGDMKDYTSKLREVRVDKNTVHFFHKDFNPYPGLTGNIISKRYYSIIIDKN